MYELLEKLFEKRGSTREKALSELADGFTNKVHHKFLVNNSITLLERCLNSIDRGRGSTKEIHLASRVIGLLSISVGCEDSVAHEILKESLPRICIALHSESEPLRISSLLECLAIITLVGGHGTNETERSMEIIWRFVYPKSSSNVVVAKPDVLATSIYAWSFLLTTVTGFHANSKIWKESLSYFSNLLDQDQPAVRIAAGAAVALIFETGSLDKFSSEAMSSGDGSVNEENKRQERFARIEKLKEKILNKVKNLSVEEGDEGVSEKDIKWQYKMFQRVLEFLEIGHFPKTSVKIGGDAVNISTWSQFLQLNFLKEFLGVGFVKHMQENELLHNVFDHTPKQQKQDPSVDFQNLSCSEEVMQFVFLPQVRKKVCTQRMIKSPNSYLNKARSQLMNKKRMISANKKAGHFGYDD